ncbi:MAG TPA: type II secretion system F family protein [Thermodesulfobacteriota bacterium]
MHQATVLVAPLARGLRRRRARRAADQLPDLLGALAAGLRAGRALPQALADAAGDTPAPLGHELALVVREIGVGRPLADALAALLARLPTEDLRLAVLALDLGRSLGGDLADLLDRVAGTIRERQRLEARIRVLTSQGQAQGWILVLLPPGLAAAIHAVDPTYLLPLVDTPAGLTILAVALLLQAAGGLAIGRIVRLEP